MEQRPLALVTGAAHRLGRLFAIALARRGFAVFLHYCRSRDAADETAGEIQALGVPVFPFRADLRRPEEIQALFVRLDNDLVEHSLSLRLLVNSAAVMRAADVRVLSVEEWEDTFTLNLRAPFLMAQQAARRMPPGGLIINVTDAGAGKPWTAYPAYTVSKAALETLTRLLARAYAPGIRVNALAPGLALPAENMPAEEWERLVNRLPLKRSASASDIAAALDYLLENESVTGQTVVIDGGYSLL